MNEISSMVLSRTMDIVTEPVAYAAVREHIIARNTVWGIAALAALVLLWVLSRTAYVRSAWHRQLLYAVLAGCLLTVAFLRFERAHQAIVDPATAVFSYVYEHEARGEALP